MALTHWSRRDFAVRMAAICAGLSTSDWAFGDTDQPGATGPAVNDGLSHTSEAIHQEVRFNASRKRLYQALTDTQQFDQVTRLSAAWKVVGVPGASPTRISRHAGGTFSLFGGHITGRQIELLDDQRIVQAWRELSWSPGDYSIARFVLAAEGSGTRLIFDHRGFPEGAGGHLAAGWYANYWEPLATYLSRDGRG